MRLDQAAAHFVGTPFRWGGRRPGVGLDCVGVLAAAATECGAGLKDYKSYGADTDPDSIMNRLIPQLEPIAVDDALPGDVLVFWIRRKDTPAHIGILAEDGTEIHSNLSVRECIRDPLDRRRTHVFGDYRIEVDMEGED